MTLIYMLSGGQPIVWPLGGLLLGRRTIYIPLQSHMLDKFGRMAALWVLIQGSSTRPG